MTKFQLSTGIYTTLNLGVLPLKTIYYCNEDVAKIDLLNYRTTKRAFNNIASLSTLKLYKITFSWPFLILNLDTLCLTNTDLNMLVLLG